jgi:beta-glucosidase
LRYGDDFGDGQDNGSRVEGFFVWSLLDNWEWDSGFTAKFGLVAQNVNTGERTPKKSYAWFADIAETATRLTVAPRKGGP